MQTQIEYMKDTITIALFCVITQLVNYSKQVLQFYINNKLLLINVSKRVPSHTTQFIRKVTTFGPKYGIHLLICTQWGCVIYMLLLIM